MRYKWITGILLTWAMAVGAADASDRGLSGLVCGADAKVYYNTYHGEGPGCGESGRAFIVSQKRDWEKKVIQISMGWYPGKELEHPRCRYFGPIFGGGAVETFEGTWQVVVDGKVTGTYSYTQEIEGSAPYEVNYTQRCKVDSGL